MKNPKLSAEVEYDLFLCIMSGLSPEFLEKLDDALYRIFVLGYIIKFCRWHLVHGSRSHMHENIMSPLPFEKSMALLFVHLVFTE